MDDLNDLPDPDGNGTDQAKADAAQHESASFKHIELSGPTLPVDAEFKRHDQASTMAEGRLGPMGRMVGLSKHAYVAAHPGHAVVFNGNVFARSLGKVWFGDIDVTDSLIDLAALAGDLKEAVYVLPEMAGRFNHADDPAWEDCVAIFVPGRPHYLTRVTLPDRSQSPVPASSDPAPGDATARTNAAPRRAAVTNADTESDSGSDLTGDGDRGPA